jgi:hypothetical protein
VRQTLRVFKTLRVSFETRLLPDILQPRAPAFPQAAPSTFDAGEEAQVALEQFVPWPGSVRGSRFCGFHSSLGLGRHGYSPTLLLASFPLGYRKIADRSNVQPASHLKGAPCRVAATRLRSATRPSAGYSWTASSALETESPPQGGLSALRWREFIRRSPAYGAYGVSLTRNNCWPVSVVGVMTKCQLVR